jgi:putative SOS response-associated peptidase YedK
MCGRFVRSFSTSELVNEIKNVSSEAIAASTGLPSNYNVAPSSVVDALYLSRDSLVLDSFRWGFANTTATKESGSSLLINARSETAHIKPTFRPLINQQRCLVPMDGFYEWQRIGSKPIPYFVSRSDRKRMWVGGLYREGISSPQQTSENKRLLEVVLLTKNSLPDLSHIHDRSPVHLQLTDAISWLTNTTIPFDHLQEFDPPGLQTWRVSVDVNSVRNNRVDLIEPIDPDDVDQQPGLFD